MANWNDPQPPRPGFGASPSVDGAAAGRVGYDIGLRRHMLSIYNYMASGVLLTGIVALLFARSPFFGAAYHPVMTSAGTAMQPTPLGWIISLSPFAFILAWWYGAMRFSEATLKAMFWGFAVTFGLSLSTLLFVYTGASIAQTFFATAGAFAGLSLWGYTTKRDLSPWGSFLIMGVWGILITLVLNALFFHSAGFDLAISFIGVFVFAGLTAYDTQTLKEQYYQVSGTQLAGRAVVLGALNLYLDFINMFLFLLRFMGNRE